jgi:SHS2 domain-containing protein
MYFCKVLLRTLFFVKVRVTFDEKDIMMQKDFEVIPHTADIKIRVYGSTFAELFKNALLGMFQSIEPHADGCRKVGERTVCDSLPCSHEIHIQAPDKEALLVDFLSQALYLSDVHNEAYFDATIDEIDERHIVATIYGVPVNGFEVVEIKAVTYHGLSIQKVNGAWQAEIVFDI